MNFAFYFLDKNTEAPRAMQVRSWKKKPRIKPGLYDSKAPHSYTVAHMICIFRTDMQSQNKFVCVCVCR